MFSSSTTVVTPSAPKVLAREVLLSPTKLPRYLDGTFSLEVPDHIRHSVLRWNTDTDVHMIAHHMPFDYLRFLVRSQFVKHLAYSGPLSQDNIESSLRG